MVGISTFALAAAAQAVTVGVNSHIDAGTDPAAMVNAVKSGGFKHVRVDVRYSPNFNYDYTPTALTMQYIQGLVANGVKVEATLRGRLESQVKGFDVLGRSVAPVCQGDTSAVETAGYNDAYAQIKMLQPWVTDFEFYNEISLWNGIAPKISNLINSLPLQDAANFHSVCADTAAATLRGMTRALRDVRAQTGRPLRAIIGFTAQGDSGFIKFLQSKGVSFDVVGLHVYPFVHNRNLVTDPWYGPSGLIGLAQQFGKPIHVNEFNCAEIYSGYTNVNGSLSMNTCGASLDRHLPMLLSAPQIEYVDLFELIDRPTSCPSPGSLDRAGAECRFGVMFNPWGPKNLDAHRRQICGCTEQHATAKQR